VPSGLAGGDADVVAFIASVVATHSQPLEYIVVAAAADIDGTKDTAGPLYDPGLNRRAGPTTIARRRPADLRNVVKDIDGDRGILAGAATPIGDGQIVSGAATTRPHASAPDRFRSGDQAARRTRVCSAQAHGRSWSSFWTGQPLTSLTRISAR
jgi:hypothetical protein